MSLHFWEKVVWRFVADEDPQCIQTSCMQVKEHPMHGGIRVLPVLSVCFMMGETWQYCESANYYLSSSLVRSYKMCNDNNNNNSNYNNDR